ncbi:MAG: hypothetical protein ACOZQL_22790, partial [Myxococcota bacterium]
MSSSWPARVLVGAGLGLVRALPRRAQLACARFIAWLAWALGIRRRIALDNLRHAFPERPEPERRAI